MINKSGCPVPDNDHPRRTFGEELLSFQTALQRYALRLGIPLDDCEDIVQEAYGVAIRDESKITNLRNYLYLAVEHAVVDYCRKRAAAKRGGGRVTLSLDREEDGKIDVPDYRERDPVESLIGEERSRITMTSITALPHEQSVVIRGRYFQGLATKEMVNEETTDGAIRVRLTRARRALRSNIAQNVNPSSL